MANLKPPVLKCRYELVLTGRSSRECRVYIDRRDWWIGYYQGDTHHYVCPIPTVVIRWHRALSGEGQ